MSNLNLSPRGAMVLNMQGCVSVAVDILNTKKTVDARFKPRISGRVFQRTTSRFMTSKPLTRTIGAHLVQKGTLNARTAISEYRCRVLSARICELRDIGFVITSTWLKDSFGQTYVEYSLKGFRND